MRLAVLLLEKDGRGADVSSAGLAGLSAVLVLPRAEALFSLSAFGD